MAAAAPTTTLVRDTVSDLLEDPERPLACLPDLPFVADDLEAFLASPEYGEHSAPTKRAAERALQRIDKYLQNDEY